MFGAFMPVLFLIGVWKCHSDIWLWTRIILTYQNWGLVEVMWVQIRALEMVGTFLPVLFMIGVWKCHLDTCLHISELLKAVECFIFIVSCVWQSMSHKIWCPKVLLPLKLKILILRPIVRAPQCDWLLVLKSSLLKTWKILRPIVSCFGVLWLLVLKLRFSELRPIENAPKCVFYWP